MGPQVSGIDEEVSAAVAAGDAGGAAARIVQGLGPGLLGYLVAVLGRESEGREVLGEVVEEVLGSVLRFRGESTVKTWLYRIAWRTAMRYRDAPERRRTRRLDTLEASGLADVLRSSTAAYQRTEAKDWLEEVRAELTPEDQSLLVLRVDRDLSWAEVAEIMGDGDAAAQGRLRKRFERIKERLRERAERDGILDE
jgi:RNA polymerase sigma-70 factor (ECF subfamily)